SPVSPRPRLARRLLLLATPGHKPDSAARPRPRASHRHAQAQPVRLRHPARAGRCRAHPQHQYPVRAPPRGGLRAPAEAARRRAPALRPEAAASADVRLLSLAPRSFRTRVGGLFLFVPLMRDIRLAEVLAQADLPGSQLIPAEQAMRTLLAL